MCIAVRKEEGMHERTHPMVTTLRSLGSSNCDSGVPGEAAGARAPLSLHDSVKCLSSLPLLKGFLFIRLVLKLPALCYLTSVVP